MPFDHRADAAGSREKAKGTHPQLSAAARAAANAVSTTTAVAQAVR